MCLKSRHPFFWILMASYDFWQMKIIDSFVFPLTKSFVFLSSFWKEVEGRSWKAWAKWCDPSSYITCILMISSPSCSWACQQAWAQKCIFKLMFLSCYCPRIISPSFQNHILSPFQFKKPLNFLLPSRAEEIILPTDFHCRHRIRSSLLNV